MSKLLGIDLGTTNTVAAVIEGTRTEVMNDEDQAGSRLTPSVVAKSPTSSTLLVGQLAKSQAAMNAENTIRSVKRLMGRRFDDPEVAETALQLSLTYGIVSGDDSIACVVMDGEIYTPQQISALVLRKIKEHAESKFGQPFAEAVITVPAYFDINQRQATIDAGRIAGLEVKHVVPEPVAAALAWGIDRLEGKRTVAVFDLGGGTFDITIMEVEGDSFTAKSINGDTFLGGDDFDAAILDWLVDDFHKGKGVDLRRSEYKGSIQKLTEDAERAKIQLSGMEKTWIRAPFIAADANGPLSLETEVSRFRLEEMTAHLVDRIVLPCQQAMKDAGIEPDDPKEIDEVILVGGMTRMPVIRDKVREIFGKEPTAPLNPDEAVATGAAIYAGIQSRSGEMSRFSLADITPLSLGCALRDDVNSIIIQRGTPIPCEETDSFETVTDYQTTAVSNVTQGESGTASANTNLGSYRLTGITARLKGETKIEITYAIDDNGILTVTAKERETNNEMTITVEGSCRLPESEVARLRAETEDMPINV